MSERIARLRIELQELEPMIWRRIDMPLSTTLEALHEAIQMTMGWTFSHLWEFDIDGRCYGDPSFREFDDEPPVYKAKGLQLGTVIARGVERFVYTYDYGDNWRHDVIVRGGTRRRPGHGVSGVRGRGQALSPGGCRRPGRFHGLSGGGPRFGARATPGHGPLVRRTVRPDRLGREAGAVRHGEHGAPAARSTGQPQDWITANETLTAIVSNGRGIDGGVFGVGPGIPIRSMMDMTALVASDYGINPVTM